MSTVPGTNDEINLYSRDGRDIQIRFAYYGLTIAGARELAGELLQLVSYAERLPDIHEHHVNLLASCALCRAEAGAQTDRLTYEEEDL